MESDFENFIQSHTDGELLSLAYRAANDRELSDAAIIELQSRGAYPEDFVSRKEKLIAEETERLSDGRQASFGQLFFGWIGIFGILGLIIGYDLYFKKVVGQYSGKAFCAYDEESRENGRYIFYVSVVTHSLFLLYYLSKWFERL